MKARAPGKLVLSGAYAVLEGARAIVTAVDRYALADTARPPDYLVPEVRAALLEGQRAPWVDARQLRSQDRKLGLGSSAAILVASLAALELQAEPERAEDELRHRVFEPALRAHAAAQAGGSGIDVAASTWGGTLIFQKPEAGLPRLFPSRLPAGLYFEVWWAQKAASTPELLMAVRQFAAQDRARHRAILTRQAQAAEQAAAAVFEGDALALLSAFALQAEALAALGDAAQVAIVPAEQRALAALARAENAVLMPAGAGGGDVVFYAGRAPGSAAFRSAARQIGLLPLELGLAAPGAGRCA